MLRGSDLVTSIVLLSATEHSIVDEEPFLDQAEVRPLDLAEHLGGKSLRWDYDFLGKQLIVQ